MARLRRFTSVLAIVGLLGFGASNPAGAENKRTITVMTQNMYLGASLDPLFTAGSVPELLAAVATTYATAVASDIHARSGAIAEEIARAHPDIVALQEVSLWRTGAFGDPAPAETVRLDFLAILLDALGARGLSYAPVVVHPAFDGEAPSATGVDVRLTDRDVLLARTDLPASALTVSAPAAGTFTAALPVPNPLLAGLQIVRGWTAVDVKLRGKSFRLVNTHLEVGAFAPVQEAQAAELLAGPAAGPLPTLVLGDLNSPADGSGTQTYAMLGAAGFRDAWTTIGAGPGLTCCQDADLRNATSALYERIDLVQTRGPFTPLSIDVVGDQPSDMVSGLWPSDHAGVIATLRLDLPR